MLHTLRNVLGPFCEIVGLIKHLILLPGPCSGKTFDINFGNRLYSKEKRRAWPLLF